MSFDHILHAFFTVQEDLFIYQQYILLRKDEQIAEKLLLNYQCSQIKNHILFSKPIFLLRSTNMLVHRLNNLLNDEVYLNYLHALVAKINSNVNTKNSQLKSLEGGVYQNNILKQYEITSSEREVKILSNAENSNIPADIPSYHQELFQKFEQSANIVNQLKVFRMIKSKKCKEESFVNVRRHYIKQAFDFIKSIEQFQEIKEKDLIQGIADSLQKEVITGIQKYENLFVATKQQLEFQKQQQKITNLKFFENKLLQINDVFKDILADRVEKQELSKKQEKLLILYDYIFNEEILLQLFCHALFLECDLLVQQAAQAIANNIVKPVIYNSSVLLECELITLEHLQLVISYVQPQQLYFLECQLKNVGCVSIFDYNNKQLQDSFVKPENQTKTDLDKPMIVKILPYELLFKEFEKRKAQILQMYANSSDLQLQILLTQDEVVFPEVIQSLIAERETSNEKSIQRIAVKKQPFYDLDKSQLQVSIPTLNQFIISRCNKYLIPGSSKVFFECQIQNIAEATIGIGIMYIQDGDNIQDELQQLDPKLFLKQRFVSGDDCIDNPSIRGIILSSDGFLYHQGERDFVGTTFKNFDVVQIIIDCDEQVLQFSINNTPLTQTLSDGTTVLVGKIDIRKKQDTQSSNLSKLQLLIDNLKKGGAKFRIRSLQEMFQSEAVRGLIYDQKEMQLIAKTENEAALPNQKYEFQPAAVVYNTGGVAKLRFAFSEPWFFNCPFGYGCHGYQ